MRWGAALVLVLACPASWAHAARPSSVRVDYLTLTPDGRHEARISVLDAQGAPVAGLGASQFEVEEDGRPVREVRLASAQGGDRALDLRVLFDPDLARQGSGDDVRELLRRLGEQLGERGRLRVGVIGGSRWLEASGDRWMQLVDRIGEISGKTGTQGLYDALYEAVRRAARLPGGSDGAVLLVTRGADPGSHHGVVDVLAVARARGRAVPVLVALLARSGRAGEAERLGRLAQHSGGAFEEVSSAEGLSQAAERMFEVVRGAYRLRFRVARFSSELERHSLSVAVEADGARRRITYEFASEDALAPPWWHGPLPWLALGLIGLAAGSGVFAFRPRRMCRLVVASGVGKGCSYELFAAPVTLGAAEGNDLIFGDSRVSRNHAVFEKRGRDIELLDLNSENGTFVNGDRITRRRLSDGDFISLAGAVDFDFERRGG